MGILAETAGGTMRHGFSPYASKRRSAHILVICDAPDLDLQHGEGRLAAYGIGLPDVVWGSRLPHGHLMSSPAI